MKTCSIYLQISLAGTMLMQGLLMAHAYPGFLCVLEGVDGSGKTTIAQKIDRLLTQKSIMHHMTKEPGATKLGTQLRTMILEKTVPAPTLSQFLMFAADRAQHFTECIVPELEAGNFIISDRMSDSSLAYQGFCNGLDLDMINMVNRWCMQNITPDLIIYLRLEAHDALERIKRNRSCSDAFEQEIIKRLHLVVHGFDTIFQERSNVIIIDALQDPDTIASEICQIIMTSYRVRHHVKK